MLPTVDLFAINAVIDLETNLPGSETLDRVLTDTYRLPTGDMGFVSHAWGHLFRIHEPIFCELVVEFFDTYEFSELSTNFNDASISFQPGGLPRTMSVINLARALELHEGDEMHNLHFLSYLSAARTVNFSSAEVFEHWSLIGNGQYSQGAPSYNLIRNPIHRLIHRMISFSIAARREGPENFH